MNILVINNAEPEALEFTEPVADILINSGICVEIIGYGNCLSTNINSFDGVILSGSPQGDDIVEHHQRYYQWIKTFDKPVLGICAGHHIIGYMFGADYLKNKEPETGDVSIEILDNHPLFEGFPRKFDVKQMHNDSISVPWQFVHLAKSSTCHNQAMSHISKPLISLQFHPEYLNHAILLNFATICARDRRQTSYIATSSE